MAQDPTFGINNFGRPKILNESQTTVKNILTILMGRPGCFPSQPQLGMNIPQYLYSFEDGIDTTALKAQLAYQCSDFLGDIESGEFDVIKTTDKRTDQPLLLLILPIEHEDGDRLILGVTLDKNQYMIYNFNIVNSQTL